jgi:hypothetical protein
MILRIKQRRIQRDRFCEMIERRIGLAELTANEPEAVVGGGKSR